MATGWPRVAGAIDALTRWPIFKPAVFVACAVPAVQLAYKLYAFFNGIDPDILGPDPNTAVMHRTGQVALWLLLLTLTITPVRRITGVNGLQRIRRMLGVWAFTYACFHLAGYLVFEQLCYSWATCRLGEIGADLVKRRFIIAGMTAFTMLLLLAITSTNGWVRRLKKNWQRLHRLAYAAAVAGIVHFIWIQKSDYSRPTRWAIWLGILFAIRVVLSIQKRRSRAAANAATSRTAAAGN